MHKLVMYLTVVFVLGSASAAHAASVSANGFACTERPVAGGRALVECTGQFPGVVGIFGATGYDIAHIEYSPDNKRRYVFMSETGCLILNAGDNAALATDRTGTKKQFPAFMNAMEWCYTSAGQGPK
jgi:hypothetical protein